MGDKIDQWFKITAYMVIMLFCLVGGLLLTYIYLWGYKSHWIDLVLSLTFFAIFFWGTVPPIFSMYEEYAKYKERMKPKPPAFKPWIP